MAEFLPFQLRNALSSQDTEPHVIDGCQVKARLRRSKHSTLFVGLLSARTTVESLSEHFRKFGTVVECRLKEDPNNKTRFDRAGYVMFSSSKEVSTVLKCALSEPNVI
jgi:RNA recognition motif-containing protein